MSEAELNCPHCASALEPGYIYLRGLFAALFWSRGSDTGMLSRRNLEQIDLGKISKTGSGGQVVVDARRCPDCGWVGFHSQ